MDLLMMPPALTGSIFKIRLRDTRQSTWPKSPSAQTRRSGALNSGQLAPLPKLQKDALPVVIPDGLRAKDPPSSTSPPGKYFT